MFHIYYSQIDPRWKNHPYPASDGYEDKTIGTSGCGPTCCAMVVSSSKETVYPSTMGDIFEDEGFRVPGGTDINCFPYVAERWGLEYKRVYSSYEAHDACKEGWFVVINVGEGLWTTGGHYILAVGATENEIEIYDPYLYDGKFDRYGRQGKVRMDGVSAWVEINTFKAYSNAQRFFAYKIDGVEPEPQPEPEPTEKIMYVNTQSKNLNVRNAPNGDIIGSLPKGTQVIVYEEVPGWSRIGDSSWVSSDYLSDTNPYDVNPGRDTVGEVKTFAGPTIIYSNPDLTGEEYNYKPNTTVVVLENTNDGVDYIKVRQTGREGYVSIDVYTDSENSGPSIPSTVGEIRRFAGSTIIYSNPDLTGTQYNYKPNTSVIILENVNGGVDKIKVRQTGRVGYVSTSVYQ